MQLCTSKAMLLVAAQIALLAAAVAAAKEQPVLRARASSWPGTLLALCLMLGGIAGLTARRSPVVTIASWCCFTAGASVMGLQLGGYETRALKRGLLQTTLLLLALAAAAPFVGYFSAATRCLGLLTLALLVGLVLLCIWPSSSAVETALSAAGAVLFATWTVHDVVERPCESPWLKSVEVFLDVFNVFVFSVR